MIADLIDPLANQVCRVKINSSCQRGPDIIENWLLPVKIELKKQLFRILLGYKAYNHLLAGLSMGSFRTDLRETT